MSKSMRCVLTPVIDERICRVMGGTPLPLSLDPTDVTKWPQIPSVGQIASAKLADVVAEPGVANLDDPDVRGAWIWDL